MMNNKQNNKEQQKKIPSPNTAAPQKTGMFEGSSNPNPLFGSSKPEAQPSLLFGGPAKTGTGALFGGDKANQSVSPFSK